MQVVAINRFEDGLMLSVGMAVEYPVNLNIYSLELGSFSVSGRTLFAAYINSEDALRPGRDSIPGRYVILELEPVEADTQTLAACEILQRLPLRYANGQVIPPWEKPLIPRVLQYRQEAGCQRCLLRLGADGETSGGMSGQMLSFLFAEPLEYRAHQIYALVVEFCRGGNSYHQGSMFGLIFERPEGWDALPEDDPLLAAVAAVYRHTMYVYNISAEQVSVLGMSPERADRVLETRVPVRQALENPLRAKR